MLAPSPIQGLRARERVGGRIEHLGEGDGTPGFGPPAYNEDGSVLQECCRMAPDGHREVHGYLGIQSRRRVEELSRDHGLACGVLAADAEHLAVSRSRRRVTRPGRHE